MAIASFAVNWRSPFGRQESNFSREKEPSVAVKALQSAINALSDIRLLCENEMKRASRVS